MRKGEKYKYANDKSNADISKELCRLVGLLPSPNSFNHIVYLFTLGLIHKVAEQARNSDKKLDKIEMELPFVGKLILNIDDEELIVKNIKFEEEFKQWLIEAANEGKSPLVEHMNKKFVQNVQEKYREIL